MARRHQLVKQKALAPAPEPEPEEEAPGIRNTPDLSKQHFQLQGAKISLHKWLQKTGEAVIVTTEMDDQGWFFLVRGVRPTISEWKGIPVRFVPSVASVGYQPKMGHH